MRLVRLSTLYPEYIKIFYRTRPGLEKRSFAEQYESLLFDSYGWSDFWRKSLDPLGYETEDILANIEPLQRAWARENGHAQPGRDWFLRLAAERIEELCPDILFINDFINFRRPWIEELRSRCPTIKLVLGWCGAPFPDPDVFKAYDIVLSCVPELVEVFHRMGHKAYHLNHAFDPRVLERIKPGNEDLFPFTFVGQIHRQSGYHLEREILLLHLVTRTPLTIFSMTRDIPVLRYFRGCAWKGIQLTYQGMRFLGMPERLLNRIPIVSRGHRYRDYPLFPVHPKLMKHLYRPVFGLEMFQTLHDSSVTLNSHLNISTHSASNMRMFEATGVGTCLLTDHKDRISELFDPDTEIVTYRSAEECAEKVRYLLENSSLRRSIASAGQARTLRDHSFKIRAQQLDEIVREAI